MGKTGNDTALVTIRGIIIPVRWDERGKVESIALFTHKEEEFLITHDTKGRKLYKFLQQLVEVTGHVTEVAGMKQIKVIDAVPYKLSVPDDSNNFICF